MPTRASATRPSCWIPPAFAKSKRSAEDALRGYKELNLRALKMARNGGVLVTCSCSFHVSEADFLAMLSSAALDARRNLHIVEKRMQSADHPVLLNVPETHYLKCIVCSVFSRQFAQARTGRPTSDGLCLLVKARSRSVAPVSRYPSLE